MNFAALAELHNGPRELKLIVKSTGDLSGKSRAIHLALQLNLAAQIHLAPVLMFPVGLVSGRL